MGNLSRLVLLVSLALLVVACGANTHRSSQGALSPIKLDHAQGFLIDSTDSYYRVQVVNRFAEADSIYQTYYLYRGERPSDLPSDGVVLHIPIRALAIGSCTHIGFLSPLDEIGSVVGACNVDRVYHHGLRARIEHNRVTPLGDAFAISVESLVKLAPEAIMLSGFSHGEGYSRPLLHSGIPIIYNNEWMESSLLGRSEWIKFVAVFFDKLPEAIHLFDSVAIAYSRVKSATPIASDSVSVIWGDDFRGVWYMPGGDSFNAHIMKEAGADYALKNDQSSGSLPLSFEKVWRDFHTADVWIGASAASVSELLARNPKLKNFESVRSRQVYSFEGRSTSTGANDYWESGVFSADIILRDIKNALLSTSDTTYSLTYLKRLY